MATGVMIKCLRFACRTLNLFHNLDPGRFPEFQTATVDNLHRKNISVFTLSKNGIVITNIVITKDKDIL